LIRAFVVVLFFGLICERYCVRHGVMILRERSGEIVVVEAKGVVISNVEVYKIHVCIVWLVLFRTVAYSIAWLFLEPICKYKVGFISKLIMCTREGLFLYALLHAIVLHGNP